ncbi:IS3 family transposase [Roseivirga sp. BDSF3-8]|uniref:IS3 family transposase n=1 Tax=Roseivirga sp. BDSF3-8 TaxID=3241598 RepID=UPI003531FF2B
MALVDPSHQLSIRHQSEVLNIPRSSFYYKPVGESIENLDLMEIMDRLFTEDPTLGVIGMQDELREQGLFYNVKRIRRLLRKMGVEPIYPKRNLSKLGQAKYVYPYLLKNLTVNRRNQVWAIDITYIPMAKGFMYLTGIIDVYSRYIVGWQLSNSLDKETQTTLLTACIEKYGKPEIINSDQGSQYTCSHWVETLKEWRIRVSMDGKGRATDNTFIERFFRTLKYKHVYLHPADDGLTLYKGINKFIEKYNNKRRHQGIGRIKPVELFKQAA